MLCDARLLLVVRLDPDSAGGSGRCAFFVSTPRRTITLEIDPAEMALRGRIGAHKLHSKYDSRELTAPAREAFLDRFDKEVDPDGVLPDAERLRRAEHARKAHFARLAYLSAKARKNKKAAGAGTPAAGEGA